MRKEIKLFLPLLLVLTLGSCNHENKDSSHKASTLSSDHPTSSVIDSSKDDSSTMTSSLDLEVSFIEATMGEEFNLEEDWIASVTGTYDKAVKLKTENDFIETPPFEASGKIEVTFDVFKTCGKDTNGKLVLKVEGLGNDGTVLETLEISEKDIMEGNDKSKTMKVILENKTGNIKKVRIGIKEAGKATNVGIKDIKVKTVK